MIKIPKKLIAPFLSYSIFLRGLFFMPHPVNDKNFKINPYNARKCSAGRQNFYRESGVG